MIAAEKANYPIRWMCHLLKVSHSGFYRWLAVKPSQRQLQDRILAQQIADIFEQSHHSYGSARITGQLTQQGWAISRKRVIRLMHQQGLVARRRPKRKGQTLSPQTPVAPNHLNRQFTCEHPDQAWVGNITDLPRTEGWRLLLEPLSIKADQSQACRLLPATAE